MSTETHEEKAGEKELKHLTGPEGLRKIGGLIQDVRMCMLTTAASDGSFDSRPMATQKTEFDGRYGS
jgi:hypothetical protein